MPEEKLWKAVIIQAILDACHVSNAPPDQVSRIQLEARKFLMGGEDFEMICDLAGLNQHVVRKRAREVISDGMETIRFKISKTKRAKAQGASIRNRPPIDFCACDDA